VKQDIKHAMRGCRETPIASAVTHGSSVKRHRNYVAEAVAALLAVVAAILVVRRRRGRVR
jgi:hypothetical protein